MSDFPMPLAVSEELEKMIGKERTEKAIASFEESAVTWKTLFHMVGKESDPEGADFFAYVDTLSREELVNAIMVGITLTKVVLGGRR